MSGETLQVSSLTLKWCQLPLYSIPFQAKICRHPKHPTTSFWKKMGLYICVQLPLWTLHVSEKKPVINRTLKQWEVESLLIIKLRRYRSTCERALSHKAITRFPGQVLPKHAELIEGSLLMFFTRCLSLVLKALLCNLGNLFLFCFVFVSVVTCTCWHQSAQKR